MDSIGCGQMAIGYDWTDWEYYSDDEGEKTSYAERRLYVGKNLMAVLTRIDATGKFCVDFMVHIDDYDWPDFSTQEGAVTFIADKIGGWIFSLLSDAVAMSGDYMEYQEGNAEVHHKKHRCH